MLIMCIVYTSFKHILLYNAYQILYGIEIKAKKAWAAISLTNYTCETRGLWFHAIATCQDIGASSLLLVH